MQANPQSIGLFQCHMDPLRPGLRPFHVHPTRVLVGWLCTELDHRQVPIRTSNLHKGLQSGPGQCAVLKVSVRRLLYFVYTVVRIPRGHPLKLDKVWPLCRGRVPSVQVPALLCIIS